MDEDTMTSGRYNPEGEEKKILELVTKRTKEAKDSFLAYRKSRFDKFYKNFRSSGSDRLKKLKEIGGDDWMSNLFVPMTASHVRAIHPRAVDSRPELKVEGRTRADMRRAQWVQGLLDYLWEKAGMDARIRKLVWQALIYGVTVGKTFWKKDAIIKTDTVVDEETMSITDVEDKSEIYNDPAFEVVDVYNFYPDPLATCIDDSRYVVHRYLLTKEQILSTYGGLIERNVPYLGSCDRGDTTDYAMVRLDVLAESGGQGSDSSGSGGAKQVESELFEVIEYWERNRFVLKAGGVVLRYGINPLGIGVIPYVSVPYEELPFEFYGIGICEQVEQPQNTLNVVRNQRIDNVTLSIQKMFIANPYALVDKNDLVARPFGIIRTNDVNAITPVRQDPMGEAAYREDALALDAGRMATGIDDWSRGIQGPATATATAVTTQKESTLERIKLFISNLETECYAKIMRYWIGMAAHLYEMQTIERIMDNGIDMEAVTGVDRPIRVISSKGDDLISFVSRDDLMGMYDFKAMSLSTLAATKELKIRRILDIMDKAVIAGADPVTKQMIPNLRELWARLFYSLDWDPKQMMNPPSSPPVPPQEGAGRPHGSITTIPSERESMNNVMQSVAPGMPMAGPDNRETPLPEESKALQTTLQVNRGL
jgi:hypothetical protein